jgi:hypothetical protein
MPISAMDFASLSASAGSLSAVRAWILYEYCVREKVNQNV